MTVMSLTSAQTVRSVSFSSRAATKAYPKDDFSKDWNMNPPTSSGLAAGRLWYVKDPKGSGNTVLRVQYNANEIGGSSAMVFRSPLPTGYTRLWFQYELMFDKDFQFVKGGKLPGLGCSETPGQAPTGCVSDWSFTGCSARMMWHCLGNCQPSGNQYVLESYLYHPGKKADCGDYYMLCDSSDGQLNPPIGTQNKGCSQPTVIKPDTWYTVRQDLMLNSFESDGKPSANGLLQHHMNNKLRLQKKPLTSRSNNKVFVSSICMESFFGGSTMDWAPSKNQFVYFNNFLVTASNPAALDGDVQQFEFDNSTLT